MSGNRNIYTKLLTDPARVVWLTIFAGFFFSFPFKLANGLSMTFTQNICSDNISVEVDSDERTYNRFTEYSYLPADDSGNILRPVYGQVGGDASV